MSRNRSFSRITVNHKMTRRGSPDFTGSLFAFIFVKLVDNPIPDYHEEISIALSVHRANGPVCTEEEK
jgi:hypothetical protein